MWILRTGTLLTVGAILVACSTSDQPAVDVVENSTRPNIVFILVDDLGWNDLSFQGSEISTPNIDGLAEQGVILDRSYAFPVCSPTRAALMSGKNPLQFGIDGPMENDAMLPEELTLLPEYLRQAGYETWMVGKWHLGMASVQAAPPARGFDHFYGHLGGFIDFYTHVYFGSLDWQRNGVSIREDGYSTDLLTAEAVRLVHEYNGEKPFFMYLSYNAPHTPLQFPPAGTPEYAGITDPDRRVFAQMTSHLDTSIAKFLQALESREILDNTLIVFMSDNGGNLQAGANNGDLRAGKNSAYEGGVRVPTLMFWPGGLEGGRRTDEPVFVQDWLPTLLDVAGDPLTTGTVDGTSVWPALARSENVGRSSPVVVGVARSKAVFDWPWKLVRDQGPGEEQPADRLFNVVDDPQETRDVAAQHSEKVELLAAELDALPKLESRGARGPTPESLFRTEDGVFDYEIRMPETKEPWAELAVAN